MARPRLAVVLHPEEHRWTDATPDADTMCAQAMLVASAAMAAVLMILIVMTDLAASSDCDAHRFATTSDTPRSDRAW